MTRRSLAAICLIVLLGGCGLFSRTENRFFALERIGGAASVAVSGAPFTIEGIQLPPGIDRREVVVRNETHQLDIRNTHQWMAPLEESVIHSLAFNLANRMPEGMVILPGQAIPPGPRRPIFVVFEEFVAGPEERFVLDARWSLTPQGQPVLTRHERIEIPLDSLESAAIAAGTSRALGELADRITTVLAGQ